MLGLLITGRLMIVSISCFLVMSSLILMMLPSRETSLYVILLREKYKEGTHTTIIVTKSTGKNLNYIKQNKL
uniref:Uncharacterized protein n=1 Tax=Solanum lycopersicum TaxID=4081 RepID=A0A3Q7I7G1_SOLLC